MQAIANYVTPLWQAGRDTLSDRFQQTEQYGQDFIRDNIPTNIRTFADTVFGDRSDITEDNFSTEELDTIRAQVRSKQRDNTYQEYKLGKERESVLAKGRNPYYVDGQLASYGKNRAKTSVSSYDYGDVSINGEANIFDSFSDPNYNISTTLGHYNAFLGEDGNTTVRDDYGWNPANKPVSLWESAKQIPKISNFEAAGNLFARTFMPNLSRKVELNLGSIGKDTPEQSAIQNALLEVVDNNKRAAYDVERAERWRENRAIKNATIGTEGLHSNAITPKHYRSRPPL